MTALTETAPARETPVRPGVVLATVIGAFFFAFGWLAGASWRVLARAVPVIWRGLVFCGLSLRYGYWRGLGLTDEQIAARPAAAPAASPAGQSRA